MTDSPHTRDLSSRNEVFKNRFWAGDQLLAVSLERLTLLLTLPDHGRAPRSKVIAPRPVLLYDNDCRICSRFAYLAKKSSKGWVDAVGLFTDRGTRIKSDFFTPKDHPDEMFWLLLGDTGYGGRSGLLPLVREIVRGRVL